MPTAAEGREMPRAGDTIDGKYELVRVLGTGGMGVVFEAEHLRLKQRCAIKMLSAEMLREKDIVRRFEREARASALLKSPHVTRVTDVATTSQGVPYIVMELLSGHDLDAELEERGSLPYPEAVDYVLQACAAVGEAHGVGIIHRDLKPGNLFLSRDPENGHIVVKVLDFGISKMHEDESRLTSAGMTMGTTLYMSPEQLRSAATVDERSDIWSLGIILYELLCGSPPFVGSAPQVAAAIVSEDPPDLFARASIPPELGLVVHRALKRAPDERFANVGELVAALSQFTTSDALGRAVAAQFARRASSRQSIPDSERSSSRRVTGPKVDVDARTVAHDVSTSAPHEVNTARRRESTARRMLLAAVAVALVAVVALVVVAPWKRTEPPAPAAGPAAAASLIAPAGALSVAPVVSAIEAAPPRASSSVVPSAATASAPAAPRLPPRSAPNATGASHATANAGARPPAPPAPPAPPKPAPVVNPPFLN